MAHNFTSPRIDHGEICLLELVTLTTYKPNESSADEA